MLSDKIRYCVRFLKWIKNNLSIIRTGNYSVLIGTPLHGNIGDQAIALAEYQFLKETCDVKNVLEIPSRLTGNMRAFKPFIGKRTILIHGGGYIGTLYLREEYMVRRVIKIYPDNKIVILPQTIDFSNDEIGASEKKKSASIYNGHKKLHLGTREKASFKLAKETFPNCSIHLIPDMVLQLKLPVNEGIDKKDVLLCLRNDKEKVLSESDVENIQNDVRQIMHESISFTDTNVVAYISEKDRLDAVLSKVNEFAAAKLVITDRLHGMVLACIAKTPCIAMDNINGKVGGVYDWISNNKYVRYVDDLTKVEKAIEELNGMDRCEYDNDQLRPYFDELKRIIEE